MKEMVMQRVYTGFLCLVAGLILSTKIQLCSAGITSDFVRNYNSNVDMPLNSDVFCVPPGYNAPQQVYITQGDHEGKGVIVSWTTPDEPGSNVVLYWAENSYVKSSAEGFVVSYKYYNYTSGYIHHCTIRDLEGILVRPTTPLAH